MRTFFLAILLVSVGILWASPQLYAQSGARSGGFSGGGRSASGGRSISRARGSSGGSGSRSRVSPAERQRLAIEQFQNQQAAAAELAERQAQLSKRQFKESLVQLGFDENRRANSKQLKIALTEAKGDFRALRAGTVAADNLGVLSVPFRLTNKEIDRQGRTLSWPSLLQREEFASQVKSIDEAILDKTLTTEEAASEFLGDLGALNESLNRSVINDKASLIEFAKARRFITGLANELRASDLLM